MRAYTSPKLLTTRNINLTCRRSGLRLITTPPYRRRINFLREVKEEAMETFKAAMNAGKDEERGFKTIGRSRDPG